MEELSKQLANHEARISNLEEAYRELQANYRETVRLIHDLDTRTDARIREVKEDLRAEISRIDEKMTARLDQFDSKLEKALETVRKSVPTWVGPLIGAIIAVCGWLLSWSLNH